jgi:hypothetical protein
MKRLISSLFILALIAGCGEESVDEETAGEEVTGDARIKMEVFDAPPPSDVEHIYLTITEVSVNGSDGELVTLAEPNTEYDFLELVNGATAVLVDTTLEPGRYTQIRLVVADENEVVVGGEAYPLKVPSGEQTGVKLKLDFEAKEDELIEIMIDFDAPKSITWTPKKYLLRPSFKAFEKVISGTVSGMVTAEGPAGAGIANALVEAVTPDDVVSTVTDDTGAYKLVLPEGMYDLKASAEGYTGVDDTHTGLEVKAEVDLTDYNFTLAHQ